ncbi:MAG: recombinase RecA, partial [Phycisphaerae bacterium]|nr:recombinase RecA [Phycisphaerae bacterium]
AQANGGVAAFIDAEHALDPTWAKRLGVNLDTLLVTQPDSGEQALEICDLLVCSGAVDIIVIDSVAALVPQNELNGDMGDVHVALQARLMSQALRKLSASISKTNTCVIFLNQIRLKIGVMFGNPQTTPGGLALKFYSSVRIDLRRVAAVKSGDVVVGSRTRAKVVKNKIAPPFRTGEFDIMFDSGISRAGDFLDLAIENDIINKTGAWFSYGDIKIGQGRETARKFITDNLDLSEEIEHKILVAKGVIVPEDASEKEDEQALVGGKSGGEGR